MTPPKLLKLGDVEWKPYADIDDICNCDNEDVADCSGECSRKYAAEELVLADWLNRDVRSFHNNGTDIDHDEAVEELAAQYEFGVSSADGSIVMARKIGGGS